MDSRIVEQMIPLALEVLEGEKRKPGGLVHRAARGGSLAGAARDGGAGGADSAGDGGAGGEQKLPGGALEDGEQWTIDHTYLVLLSSLGVSCVSLALPAVVLYFGRKGESDVHRQLLLEAVGEVLCRYDAAVAEGRVSGRESGALRAREQVRAAGLREDTGKLSEVQHWLLLWMREPERTAQELRRGTGLDVLIWRVLQKPDPGRTARCRELLMDAACALKQSMWLYALVDEDTTQSTDRRSGPGSAAAAVRAGGGAAEGGTADEKACAGGWADEDRAVTVYTSSSSSASAADASLPSPAFPAGGASRRGAAANLHYFYNVDYFYHHSSALSPDAQARALLRRQAYEAANERLLQRTWSDAELVLEPIEGERRLLLQVQYPGMLMGLGYKHQAQVGGSDEADAQIKTGFTFDYVSGLPYLPGSSVKGILRSAFRDHRDLVRALLIPQTAGGMGDGTDIALSREETDALLDALERAIFGEAREKQTAQETGARQDVRQDVFLDAFPVETAKTTPQERELGRGRLIGDDFVTSHRYKADRRYEGLVRINPVRMLRVLPGVRFCFRFLLGETVVMDAEGNRYVLEPEVKLELFSALLQALGAGAKANVGYGRLRACGNGPEEYGISAGKSGEAEKAQKAAEKKEVTERKKITGTTGDFWAEPVPVDPEPDESQGEHMGEGVLKQYFDEKGFGFVTLGQQGADPGATVFCHQSAFGGREEIAARYKGRRVKVIYVHQQPRPGKKKQQTSLAAHWWRLI